MKAFTWGYHGWGSAAQEFVRAVDTLERRRGFRSPVFVDLRISRKVRAAAFLDHRFEAIVSRSRYRWMRELGNRRIQTGKGQRIQIAEPEAAEDLFDLIVELHRQRRRTIAFCSCLEPILRCEDGLPGCHRVTVASLLLKAARQRGIGLEVTEWPGGTPESIDLKVPETTFKSVVRGVRYVPVAPVGRGVPAIATLPWGSRVRVRGAQDACVIVTGPAYVRRGWWHLEVDAEFEGQPADAQAVRRSRELLKAGYGPRSFAPKGEKA